MALRPLHPALVSYLRAAQRSTTPGTHAFLRRYRAQSDRAVYRWRRRLGAHLLIVPSVLSEALGLTHAHLFIRDAGTEWLSCPYAVEAAWGTSDFSREVLYLHCLVPFSHQRALAATWRRRNVVVIWSGTGWQQFLARGDPIAIPRLPKDAMVTLVARDPFIVPVMAESWEYPNSMRSIWDRAEQRLGLHLREYLRRTPHRRVDGKRVVGAAFAALGRERLILQHVIRCHPLLSANIEVFVNITGSREHAVAMLESLRAHLHAIETYPTGQGFLCRLLGAHTIFHALITLPQAQRSTIAFLCCHTKRHSTVRFQYEKLFDPKGTWRMVRRQ